MTEATPLAFVNAVVAGVNTTSELSAATKVTTAPGSSAPLASLSVAVALRGVPNITELEAVLKVRELRLVVVGVVGVVVVVVVVAPVVAVVAGLPPHPLRQKNRAKKISSSNGCNNLPLVNLAIVISFS